MKFQFVNLLPASWVDALCITLFHSLWMGIILSLLTSLIILTTRKSTAAMRYNLLTAALFLFVACIGFTFYTALDPATTISKTFPGADNGSVISALDHPADQVTTPGLLGYLNGFMNVWNMHASQIVMIWFLVICAKGIQLMAGLHAVHYLKRTSIFDAGKYWEDKVSDLSARLGISMSIKIVQSALAKAPMVAGHFKPVILLPLGMLNGLSAAEVEAILCHELAHIKRRDYLVNILQSAIEIVFFFNPAVLWVSNLIKEERENCCDDLALSNTGSKQEYIKALLSCQEFKYNGYAMAATGHSNQLVDRVRRMVYNKSSSLNKIEKTILTLALISFMIFSAAFTGISETDKTTPSLASMQMQDQDTTKKVRIKKPVKKKVVVKKATDSKEVTAAKEETRSLLEEKRAAMEEANAAKEEANAMREEARAAKEEADVAKEEARIKAMSVKNEIKVPISTKTPVSIKSAVFPITAPAPPEPPEIKSVADQIKDDLLKDGLVSQVRNLKYTLNKNKFKVNGELQTEAVHKKYLRRYLQNPNQTIETTIKTD